MCVHDENLIVCGLFTLYWQDYYQSLNYIIIFSF